MRRCKTAKPDASFKRNAGDDGPQPDRPDQTVRGPHRRVAKGPIGGCRPVFNIWTSRRAQRASNKQSRSPRALIGTSKLIKIGRQRTLFSISLTRSAACTVLHTNSTSSQAEFLDFQVSNSAAYRENIRCSGAGQRRRAAINGRKLFKNLEFNSRVCKMQI